MNDYNLDAFFKEFNLEYVVCINCFRKWNAIFPKETMVKTLECPTCSEQGYVQFCSDIKPIDK